MDDNQVCFSAHPQGEPEKCDGDRDLIEQGKAVETFGGKVFVRWDAGAAVTAFAPVAYFLEFLKANGLWQQWVEDCPLRYGSPNAPPKADILGTILLSVLAGHKRYAHVTTIRSDGVLPGLLGMKRVRSEDAVRGYNPTKHGRPSHVYQTYFIAAIRMVLDVEVQAGNQTASLYAQPGLWAWLERRPREQWPKLLRGDIGWGNEGMMVECERRSADYLFKIRQTTKVKQHIAQLVGHAE